LSDPRPGRVARDLLLISATGEVIGIAIVLVIVGIEYFTHLGIEYLALLVAVYFASSARVREFLKERWKLTRK